MTIVTAAGNKITLGGSYGLHSTDRCVSGGSGCVDGDNATEPSDKGSAGYVGFGGNAGNVSGVLEPVRVPIWRRFTATNSGTAYGVSEQSLQSATVDF